MGRRALTARICNCKWRVIPTDDMESVYAMHGQCDPPWKPHKAIRFDTKLTPGDTMETIIHEALHAGLWQLDDGFVTEWSRDVRRILESYFEFVMKESSDDCRDCW